MKKIMRKSMSMFSCILIYIVGLLTADLVKPMLEKIPVVGGLFGDLDEKMSALGGDDSDDDLDA